MENVNGRRLVEGGDLCERRNGNVDDLGPVELEWLFKCLKKYILLHLKSQFKLNLLYGYTGSPR